MNNDTNNANVVGENPTVKPVGGVVTPEVPIQPESQVMDVPKPESQVVGSQVMDAAPEAPQVSTPEAPVVEPPVASEPVADSPVANTPVAETPVTETPVAETPVTPEAPQAPSVEPIPVEPPVVAPMPGFDDPGVVGTTPPVSLEAEKKPEKPKNKLGFIIIVVIVLAAVGFGTYYILNYTDLLKNSSQVTVEVKNVEVEVGEKLPTDVKSFATVKGTDSKNCSVDTSEVNVNKEGAYKFTVTCGNTSKLGKVTVSGNSNIAVDLKDVYIVKGDTVKPEDFIVEPNSEATYSFADEDIITGLASLSAGQYDVIIKVTLNDNTREVVGKLTIFENPLKGYIICTSNAQNVTDTSIQMTVSDKFAIVEDGSNGYGKVAFEIHTFTFGDETEYKKYVDTYEEDGNVVINNISGKAEFDSASKTITLTNYMDSIRVNSDFGESVMTNYGSIKSHFENTLGYTCRYERSE